jgi:hypothetical protein
MLLVVNKNRIRYTMFCYIQRATPLPRCNNPEDDVTALPHDGAVVLLTVGAV